jgi:hypothetical protein
MFCGELCKMENTKQSYANMLGTMDVTQTCVSGNFFNVATVSEWALAGWTSKQTMSGTRKACDLLKLFLRDRVFVLRIE